MHTTMMGAIGFQEELVRRPAEMLGATRLALIATKHPKVAETRRHLERWAKDADVEMHVSTVKDAYDFVEWYTQWATARTTDTGSAGPIFVNLTAGHAVAISTAALQATVKNLPCVCYDHLEDHLHHLSPSILLRLDDLIPRDRQALQLLAKGPRGVGDLVGQMRDRPSTVSRTLDRLEANGFLTVRPDPADNRRRVAELRPGVRAFLDSVLAT